MYWSGMSWGAVVATAVGFGVVVFIAGMVARSKGNNADLASREQMERYLRNVNAQSDISTAEHTETNGTKS